MTLDQSITIALDEIGVKYQEFTHPAVFTCEEAMRLCPTMPGKKSKNLFLRDKKGKKYYFVATTYEKQVDLKSLGQRLGVSGLSFASPERMMSVLGVEPGSVGVLALVSDVQRLTTVYIDAELMDSDYFSSHPGVNTVTLVFRTGDLEKFLKHTGHEWKAISLI